MTQHVKTAYFIGGSLHGQTKKLNSKTRHFEHPAAPVIDGQRELDNEHYREHSNLKGVFYFLKMKFEDLDQEIMKFVALGFGEREMNQPLVRGDRRVVCAAIKAPCTGRIICGVRHFDDIMRAELAKTNSDHSVFTEQGFVDNFGKYLTREEAMKVAGANGQLIANHGPQDQLFSEDLY